MIYILFLIQIKKISHDRTYDRVEEKEEDNERRVDDLSGELSLSIKCRNRSKCLEIMNQSSK